jgi:hypothetical protein
MMEAHLGVTTCDKCGKLMEKGQPILVIAEGNITESDDELTFQGSCIRYACHLDCWDGVKEHSFAPRVRNINIAEGDRVCLLLIGRTDTTFR